VPNTCTGIGHVPAPPAPAKPEAKTPGVEVRSPEREFSIDNLLVRIHFIVVMIRWTGLAPWEFELHFPGSLTSTLLGALPTHTVDYAGFGGPGFRGVV